MVIRPKSATQAAAVLSTRMFACHSSMRACVPQKYLTHSFEIPMNNAVVVEIGHSRHDLRQLNLLGGKEDSGRNCKLTH